MRPNCPWADSMPVVQIVSKSSRLVGQCEFISSIQVIFPSELPSLRLAGSMCLPPPRQTSRGSTHCRRNARQFDPATIAKGDVVGIGIHSGNALRGYEVGRIARERGAWVVFGGIHATLYPDEAPELGGAHAVVKGDGDRVWANGHRRLPARHATATL